MPLLALFTRNFIYPSTEFFLAYKHRFNRLSTLILVITILQHKKSVPSTKPNAIFLPSAIYIFKKTLRSPIRIKTKRNDTIVHRLNLVIPEQLIHPICKKKKSPNQGKKTKKGESFVITKVPEHVSPSPSPWNSIVRLSKRRDRTKSERRGAFHQHEIIIHDQCSGSRFASFIIGSDRIERSGWFKWNSCTRRSWSSTWSVNKVFLLLLLLSCWTRKEILLLLFLQCYCSAFTQSWIVTPQLTRIHHFDVATPALYASSQL